MNLKESKTKTGPIFLLFNWRIFPIIQSSTCPNSIADVPHCSSFFFFFFFIAVCGSQSKKEKGKLRKPFLIFRLNRFGFKTFLGLERLNSTVTFICMHRISLGSAILRHTKDIAIERNLYSSDAANKVCNKSLIRSDVSFLVTLHSE